MRSPFTTPFSILLASLLACGALSACSAPALTPADAAALRRPTESYGALVYVGSVTPDGAPSPTFRYERRVETRPDGARVSTHVTVPFEGGEPLLVQRATQGREGQLLAYEEIHGQLHASFRFDREDVVVGPTLFEHIRAHLAELRRGEVVPFTFWSQGDRYGFELRLEGDAVEMRPASFVVGLALDPLRFQLGARDEIASYHGRIPLLWNGEVVDAEVLYRYETAFR